jgi:hypothetical protein
VRAHITGECSAMRVKNALPVLKRPTLACTRNFCVAEPFGLDAGAGCTASAQRTGRRNGLEIDALMLLGVQMPMAESSCSRQRQRSRFLPGQALFTARSYHI